MSKTRPIACTQCDGILTFLMLCEKCGTIAPPQEIHPYDRLDMPSTLSFSQLDLQKSLRQRMMLVHPDRLIGSSPQQRLRAQQHTVSLNQAYQALEDPYQRALCLSQKLFGEDLPAAQGEVLLEVFDWQDRLSQGSSEDSALEAYLLERHLQEVYKKLESAIQAQNTSEASTHLARFRYLSKLLKDHQFKYPPNTPK